jgi:ABC-type phosphate transport system auxiliary subunit
LKKSNIVLKEKLDEQKEALENKIKQIKIYEIQAAELSKQSKSLELENKALKDKLEKLNQNVQNNFNEEMEQKLMRIEKEMKKRDHEVDIKLNSMHENFKKKFMNILIQYQNDTIFFKFFKILIFFV